MKQEEIKRVVREGYAKIVRNVPSGCGSPDSNDSVCCGTPDLAEDRSKKIGYSEVELSAVPEKANLGLGCGNPVALASLKEGETVIDLGSGGGIDCFLAANQVGEDGRVVGVDMTPEMIDRARENARKEKYTNVEFRLGEIENLPAADNFADVVISNCVINLSPDKSRVFKEAFRVLKPGGRLMISDIVLTKELPDFVRSSIEAYVGCVAGATLKDAYLELLKQAGFREVKVIDETSLPAETLDSDPTAQSIVKDLKIPDEGVRQIARSVVSIKVFGIKPRRA
jgi:ubiquinone/menaquinone biosynthesis C-methylase UbiE